MHFYKQHELHLDGGRIVNWKRRYVIEYEIEKYRQCYNDSIHNDFRKSGRLQTFKQRINLTRRSVKSSDTEPRSFLFVS